jgi:hypothetical protein
LFQVYADMVKVFAALSIRRGFVRLWSDARIAPGWRRLVSNRKSVKEMNR